MTVNPRPVNILRLRERDQYPPKVRVAQIQEHSLRKALEKFWRIELQPEGYSSPIFTGNTLDCLSPTEAKISYEAQEA